MTDLRICLRKKNYVIQDYSNGRKQIKDKDGKKLFFKYKKEAKAYCKELTGAVERKEIKLIDRHKFLDKFKEYGLLRIAQAVLEKPLVVYLVTNLTMIFICLYIFQIYIWMKLMDQL